MSSIPGHGSYNPCVCMYSVLYSKVYSNNDQEGSTKIINFMAPRAGILVVGRGHIAKMTNKFFVKIVYFMTPTGWESYARAWLYVIIANMYYLLLYQYTAHWRDYNATFLCNCWFFFILWWDSWYANMKCNCKLHE